MGNLTGPAVLPFPGIEASARWSVSPFPDGNVDFFRPWASVYFEKGEKIALSVCLGAKGGILVD